MGTTTSEKKSQSLATMEFKSISPFLHPAACVMMPFPHSAFLRSICHQLTSDIHLTFFRLILRKAILTWAKACCHRPISSYVEALKASFSFGMEMFSAETWAERRAFGHICWGWRGGGGFTLADVYATIGLLLCSVKCILSFMLDSTISLYCRCSHTGKP